MYKKNIKWDSTSTSTSTTGDTGRVETDHHVQEQVMDNDENLAKALAKSKNIVLMKNATFKQKNLKCGDCKKELLARTWFGEEILFFGKPMIKYWFIWRKELKPAAYSWPTRDPMYLCPECFAERDSARKRTSSLEQAREVAKKSKITLINGGPYFPDMKRRFCKTCKECLTNRGWFSSVDSTKNDKEIYYCWDIRNGELVSLAVKVVGQNEYYCIRCYKGDGEKVY